MGFEVRSLNMKTYSSDQLNGTELKLTDILHKERCDPH